MKVSHVMAATSLLAISVAPLFAQGIDRFDPVDYVQGNAIGQFGPWPPWTELGTWTAPDPNTVAATITAQNNLEITQVGNAGYGAVAHPYLTTGLASPYTISFDLTLNSINSIEAGGVFPTATNAGDYLNVFDRASMGSDFAGDGTWLIRGGRLNASGGSTTEVNYNPSAPLNWYAFNYTPLVQNAFNQADVIDTGIALIEGATYHFTVTILGNGRWNLRLDDGSSVYDSSTAGGPMGFRSAAAMPGGNLHWGFADNGENADLTDGVSLTLDNVAFAVPEPGTGALLLGGGVLGALGIVFLRKRKN